MQTTYIDNNATTPIAPEVFEAMTPYLKDLYFNPGSLYAQGEAVSKTIDQCRQTIAAFFGVESDEIIFTASATEANNMAIKGVLEANPERRHIITTSVEHPSVLNLCKDLERRGYQVTYLPVDGNGQLDPVDLIDSLRADTAIVSIMHANNETGVIFPIDKLSKIVKKTDPMIVFHTDATQTVGKLPLKLSAVAPYVDMLSMSGHKIYAPKGVGLLYRKKLVLARPLIIGGHQERGQRAGTENVANIVALTRAFELISSLSPANNHQNAPIDRRLRDSLERFVINTIAGVKINGPKAPRLDGTSSISFQGIEGEGLIYGLSKEGVCCSTGSACSSGTLEPSHVLAAMGVPFEYAHGTLRFSFGRYNSQKDLDHLIAVLPNVVKNLRRLSPYWDSEKDQFRADPLK